MLVNSMQDSPSRELTSVDEIETLRKSISTLSNEIKEIVTGARGTSSAWRHTDLLMSSCRMKYCMKPYKQLGLSGLNWRTSLPLEVLFCELVTRSDTLLRLLHLPNEELVGNTNSVNENIITSQVLDAAWLDELQLRYSVDIHTSTLEESRINVEDQVNLMARMALEEESLISDRKRYMGDLSSVRQSILKFKARYEEASHHVNVFSNGASLMAQQEGAEEMRCSFNELRRLNSTLEERLVLTGVSKQKVMNDLKTEYHELRASCSKNPTRHQKPNDETLQDLNLSPQTLNDISEIWRASLPAIDAHSLDNKHSDMLTFLSSSLGFFGAECIEDLADLSLTESHAEERAKLLGTLSMETHRYRCISGALQAAIKDAELFFNSDRFESIGRIIRESCETIKRRLGCLLVVVWKRSHDKLVAYDNLSDSSISGPFSPNMNPSNTSRIFKVGDPGLSGELALVAAAGHLNPNNEFETFTTKTDDHSGLTVIRNVSESVFPAFAGLYCEQLFRRLMSAIAPMQQVQIRRISDQRPLDLVECMFELRSSSNSPSDTIRFVNNHLDKLFRACDVKIYIPFDNYNEEKVVLLSLENPDGVHLPHAPREIAGILKPNATNTTIDEEDRADPTVMTENLRRHVIPVVRGRQLLMVLLWHNPEISQSTDGFDDPRFLLEFCYDESSTNQRSVLNAYLGVLEGVLCNWFQSSNLAFGQSQELASYEEEEKTEEALIYQLLRDPLRKKLEVT